MSVALIDATENALPLTPLGTTELGHWLNKQNPELAAHVAASTFKAKAGETCLLPGSDGPAGVLVGLGDMDDPWAWAALPFTLAEGAYQLPVDLAANDAEQAALYWAIGAYRFDRYRRAEREPAALVWPEQVDRIAIGAAAETTALVRDLVNTPANDLGPAELEEVARATAERFSATIEVIAGDSLLQRNFPMIHAVGRASVRAPRLIDLRWGAADAPKVTIIGKGVCFDSGGLDLKPASAMLTMKKDMGGAAHALGVAQMVMATKLPVRLRMLIPAVENAVSGNAFRPMDVLKSRNGLTVEVGNTDAEGRLVLADALSEAADEKPQVIIDFATLTGAARVALGAELPALFANDEALADGLAAAGLSVGDPLWRLPLWPGYRRMLKSQVADISSTGEGGLGGAITAALFLERFIGEGQAWAHIDLNAWNPSARLGRPKGGEAMGLRAVHRYLKDRFQ